jgi:type II secretory pathway pseudopilin PulG
MRLIKIWVSPRFQQSGWSLIETLAAIIVVGIGVTLFTKVQKMASYQSGGNSKILVAGKMIEKHLEDTRILVSQDTIANWPPSNKTLSPTKPNNITLVSTVSDALSPVDGAVVLNVKRLDIKASWTQPNKDSLVITTYVAKRF